VVTRPEAGSIPDAPGSYQFVDADGRVVYVGKAKSLRSRLGSYFQDPAGLAPRTVQMLEAADHVEWMVVGSEAEALLLEHNLIRRHQPRYNVRLKDDKSYPLLALTVGDEWPRPAVVRGRKHPGVRYFGPYPNAGAIRGTLDLLLRSFPVRTCSDGKLARHERLGRPCLLFHIERCSGPCVGAVDHESYDRMVRDLAAFFGGETGALTRSLTSEMRAAAGALDFERASRIRDQLAAVAQADAVRQMELDRPEDLDVLAIAGDDLEAAVQVFHVRAGAVVGRSSLFVDKVEDLSPGGLVARVLVDVYADAVSGVPPQVLVEVLPDDQDSVVAYLSERRGRPVAVRVPVRGPKRALLDTVARNAEEGFTRHRLARAADHNSRARALESLQRELHLPEPPLRIECYDMSHLQGTDYVGSMVVFEDGLPKKSEYRRFSVATVPGNDDYAAMEEVLTRRLTALLAERQVAMARPRDSERSPSGGEGPFPDGPDGPAGPFPDGPDGPDRPDGPAGPFPEGRAAPSPDGNGVATAGTGAARRRFAYPPKLLLLDGGLGQLHVGMRVLDRLGLTDEIPIASLAKSYEEVFVPGSSDPIRLPRQAEALYLLQRVRDEAHRFAITYHRTLRGKRMTAGALDGVVGLGPKRRARLIEELGGLQGLRAATRADLHALRWLPDAVGDMVYEHLHDPSSAAVPRVASAGAVR